MPAAAAAGGVAVAASAAYWDHNRSVMRMATEAEAVQFIYEVPRGGLGDLGIRSGTLLFDGRNTGGNAYAGNVTTFSRQCGDLAFAVSGEATSDGNRLIVSGQKPNRDRNCRTSGYRNETLVFELRQVRN